MNKKMIEIKKIIKKISSKKKLCYSFVTLIVVTALISGLVYAWFFQKMDMATLLEIGEPNNIAILGPGASKMEALDLSYTDADKSGNKVTIKRVICVQSEAEKFQLEIAHTTNLKNLEFKLYPAEEIKNDSKESGNITESGFTYQYKNEAISGKYINEDRISKDGYKYANQEKHQTNYGMSNGETYGSVQSHAEPIYWKTDDALNADNSNDVTIDDKINHRTYYVCEISWTEETKETDIFYILAKTS